MNSVVAFLLAYTVFVFFLTKIRCCLRIFGNILVIYAMTRKQMPKRKSNYYILSVAVVDCFIGILTLLAIFAVSCYYLNLS